MIALEDEAHLIVTTAVQTTGGECEVARIGVARFNLAFDQENYCCRTTRRPLKSTRTEHSADVERALTPVHVVGLPMHDAEITARYVSFAIIGREYLNRVNRRT